MPSVISVSRLVWVVHRSLRVAVLADPYHGIDRHLRPIDSLPLFWLNYKYVFCPEHDGTLNAR
jgi:hypothetical protein